jgi:hypothetical protein
MTAVKLERNADGGVTGNVPIEGLQARTMLVELHVSVWNVELLDRKTGREVAKQKGAKDGAVKAHRILAPKAPIEPLRKVERQARADHYRLTLPWGKHQRILSSALFFEHSELVAQDRREEFEQALRKFVREDYPRILVDAPAFMGELWDPRLFPHPSEIAKKFAFRVEISPVPEAGDFRVELGAETERRLRRQIERSVVDRALEAQRHLWGQLKDRLGHYAAVTADEDRDFKDSTVEKMAELAALAPKMSLAPDPLLEEICAEIAALGRRHTADELQANDLARSAAAREAARIEAKMAAAFGC